MVKPEYREDAILTQDFGSRLRELIPKGENHADFAKRIGVASSTFATWLGNRAMPKADALASIHQATGVDLNWLITGIGGREIADDEFVKVRRFQIVGSAGGGAFNGEELEGDPIMFRKDWLRRQVGVAPENLSVIKAKGDSNEPTIRDGALLLVNHAIERIENDGFYAINMDGDLYIKRVQKKFGGGLIIKSDNPAYDDFTIEKPEVSNLKIIGQIKWASGTV